MTLPTGSRLGPYEVVSALAAGGMGEVYRARDSRLHRELAIKVLPASVAGDTEFLNRFQSEARAASALNHPNIVTIHDIGSADGISYIAMELIEGKTVRELLDGGPPPLKKTLQIAAQAADGLAAAHAARHRASGLEAREPDGLQGRRRQDPRLRPRQDDASVCEGGRSHRLIPGRRDAARKRARDGRVHVSRAGFGRSLDFRSDQFSLGTILYEMVTGKRAWKRNSAAETLTAIIREDPQPSIATAAPSTPMASALDRRPLPRQGPGGTLRLDPGPRAGPGDGPRSPQRDPRREPGRMATASPTRKTRRLVRSPRRAGGGGGSPARVAPARQRRTHRCPIGSRSDFAAARSGRAASLPTARRSSTARPGTAVRRASIRRGRDRPRRARSICRPEGSLAISANSELAFLRRPPLLHVLRQPGILVRAGLEGGVGRDVLENVQAADWSPDGTQLAVAREVDGKVRLEYPIGKTLYETKIADQTICGSPRTARGLPSGATARGSSPSAFPTASAGSCPKAGFPAPWASPGPGRPRDLVHAAEAGAGQQPGADGGHPFGKAEGSRPGSGTVASLRHRPRRALLLARSDLQIGLRGSPPSTGREQRALRDRRQLLSDLSSDGRRVLFGDRNALFLRATDGSPPLRLGDGPSAHPRLSPDGKWVLVIVGRPGSADARPGRSRRRAPDRIAQVRWRRVVPGRRTNPLRDSRSERAIPSARARAGVRKGDRDPDPARRRRTSRRRVSPDGASLPSASGAAATSGSSPLAGRRSPGDSPPPRGSARGCPVGWSADGRHLFMHRVGDVPDRVMKLDLATGRIEPLEGSDPGGSGRHRADRPGESRARRPLLGLHLHPRSLQPLRRRRAEVNALNNPSL